jgi:hypothetical protein
MRSHGLPQFPDPPTRRTNVKILIGGSGINPETSQYHSAQDDCSGLLPAGGKGYPTITPADRIDYLKAVACVRAHGVPDFPDPTFVDGQVSFHIPAVDFPQLARRRQGHRDLPQAHTGRAPLQW